MVLPMSLLLPGLAPDLAWTLGMSLTEPERRESATLDGQKEAESPSISPGWDKGVTMTKKATR